MDNKKKILCIVEGEYTEKAVLEQVEAVFSLDFTICCFKANIYSLYKKLKEMDFEADIKQVLLELHPNYKVALDGKFAYTYLIFDFDAYHPRKDDSRTLEEIVSDNILKIQEMADFFINETDPTIGKLYINYPMVEAFRACDMPFDPNYQNEYIALPDMKEFKEYAGRKRMAQKRLDTYSSYDFKELTRMNIYKLSHIMRNNWGHMDYRQYLAHSDTSKILKAQIRSIEQTKLIAVLSTMLFVLTDYYGNQKNKFYDFIMK